jgi:hypothetical protein
VRDHTTYWQNRDGFVLPVLDILSRAAGASWRARLLRPESDVAAQSEWRVRCLKAMQWVVVPPFLFVGLERAADLENVRRAIAVACKTAGITKLFAWVPNSLWAPAFRWGAVVAVAWIAWRVLRAVWDQWVCAEQQQVLRNQKPEKGSELFSIFEIFGTLALVLTILVWSIAFLDWSTIPSLWAETSSEKVGVQLVVIWTLCNQMVKFLARKLRPKLEVAEQASPALK